MPSPPPCPGRGLSPRPALSSQLIDLRRTSTRAGEPTGSHARRKYSTHQYLDHLCVWRTLDLRVQSSWEPFPVVDKDLSTGAPPPRVLCVHDVPVLRAWMCSGLVWMCERH